MCLGFVLKNWLYGIPEEKERSGVVVHLQIHSAQAPHESQEEWRHEQQLSSHPPDSQSHDGCPTQNRHQIESKSERSQSRRKDKPRKPSAQSIPWFWQWLFFFHNQSCLLFLFHFLSWSLLLTLTVGQWGRRGISFFKDSLLRSNKTHMKQQQAKQKKHLDHRENWWSERGSACGRLINVIRLLWSLRISESCPAAFLNLWGHFPSPNANNLSFSHADGAGMRGNVFDDYLIPGDCNLSFSTWICLTLICVLDGLPALSLIPLLPVEETFLMTLLLLPWTLVLRVSCVPFPLHLPVPSCWAYLSTAFLASLASFIRCCDDSELRLVDDKLNWICCIGRIESADTDILTVAAEHCTIPLLARHAYKGGEMKEKRDKAKKQEWRKEQR